MACANPDGTLTSSGKALLDFLKEPHPPEKIAATLGQPLFKVRSSLREMVDMGLIRQEGEAYVITEEGRAKL